ncbi:MAG: GNAT family N-acetyltransferase [Alphaproteobacteria bacterium]|nr:GNAT family N-acetyltransferase [Alphaproteobacteria bacterium]
MTHICETDRLHIRNWRDEDLDLMHVINSDEDVMAFFPRRRTREQCADLLQVLKKEISETGYGFFALERKDTGEPIGFCGLAMPRIEPILPEGTVEIGWRLATPHWKKGYATEAAMAMLKLGFTERGLEEIVSFAVFNNQRSLAVMERIGLKPDPSRDFDHPRIPDTHPQLRRHTFYALSRDEWDEMERAR